MSKHFLEYELDEFRPYPSLSVYVYGTVSIRVWGSLKDWDWDVDSITIDGYTDRNKGEELSVNHPLYSIIVASMTTGGNASQVEDFIAAEMQNIADEDDCFGEYDEAAE
jgi:hypothetical protein